MQHFLFWLAVIWFPVSIAVGLVLAATVRFTERQRNGKRHRE